jgi:hypothetical protein
MKMNGNTLAYLARVVLAAGICLQAGGSVAEPTTRKSQARHQACASLMGSTLDTARNDAQKIPAEKIRSQISDLANKLGRDPSVQATLECFMRYRAER